MSVLRQPRVRRGHGHKLLQIARLVRSRAQREDDEESRYTRIAPDVKENIVEGEAEIRARRLERAQRSA